MEVKFILLLQITWLNKVTCGSRNRDKKKLIVKTYTYEKNWGFGDLKNKKKKGQKTAAKNDGV